MAYTPTNWVTGDTVNATKLNKLEQGVANAGVGIDAFIYKERGTGNWQIVGDFNSALAKVQDGVPLIAVALCGCIYSSVDAWWTYPNILLTYYEDNTQTIELRIDSAAGFSWTSSGVYYYD